MTAPSLERRLVGWLVALFLATLLLAVGTYFVVAMLRGVDMEEGFEEAMSQTAASLSLEGGRMVLRPTEKLRAMTWYPDFAVVVSDPAGGPPLSLGHPPADAAALLRLRHGAFALGQADGYRRAAVRPMDVGGVTVNALVVTNQTLADAAQWMMDEIVDELLPFLIPLLIGSLILVPWTVRRSLASLRALGHRVAAIGPDGRGGGLDLTGVPSEVLPLVKAVDHTLGRLQTAVQQQRRFTANAAHELRTPLAVLRTRLESLPDTTDRAALLRDTDRMVRLVAQLLAMARLQAGQVAADEEVELGALCLEVVADLAPLAIADGKEIVLEPAPCEVVRRGNRGALCDAVRNLAENALRFTPPGGAVTVLIEAGGAIVVRDHGPGVPVDQRDCVFEPFWRGSGGGSAGLGLSIVADIAAAHRGSITVGDAPGGGAEFRLALPAAP
jgi:signal transduction histidine kinase